MLPTTKTYSEFVAESVITDAARRWLLTATKKAKIATSTKLVALFRDSLASLFDKSEADKLQRPIEDHANQLVLAYENLKRTVRLLESAIRSASDEDIIEISRSLKTAAIETRQLAARFIKTLDDYQRANTKGGKLSRSGSINMKLLKTANEKLTRIQMHCDSASKASAFLITNNKEAASRQLKQILDQRL